MKAIDKLTDYSYDGVLGANKRESHLIPTNTTNIDNELYHIKSFQFKGPNRLKRICFYFKENCFTLAIPKQTTR